MDKMKKWNMTYDKNVDEKSAFGSFNRYKSMISFDNKTIEVTV